MPPDPAANWIRASQVALIFCGLMYLLLGVGCSPLIVMGGLIDDPEAMPLAFSIVMGVFVFVMGAGFGAANFVVAWGLGGRRKWAWYAGIVLGGLYLPSGCLLFGVVLLASMLNGDVRKAFEV